MIGRKRHHPLPPGDPPLARRDSGYVYILFPTTNHLTFTFPSPDHTGFTMPYFAFAISLPLWYAQKLQENWVNLWRGEGVKTTKND